MIRTTTALLFLAAATLMGCGDRTSFRWDGGAPDLRRPDAYPFWQDTGSAGPLLDGLGDGMMPPRDHAVGPDMPAGVLQAPFKLTFENNNGGLTGTRDWEWGAIQFKAGTNCDSSGSQQPPTAGHSGTRMWGTKINDCYSPLGNAASGRSAGVCTNTNLSDDSVLTLKAAIPSWSVASLVFYQWVDINFPFDWYEVRINGKVVAQTNAYTSGCRGSSSPPTWVKQRVVLDDYTGTTATITFHFMATKVVQVAGWYLDDVQVENN